MTGDKGRWLAQHGAGPDHGPGRRNRQGKVVYRTFWQAAREATFYNLQRRNDADPKMMEPYPCRWADHWAHGETAPEHWHIGRERERLL